MKDEPKVSDFPELAKWTKTLATTHLGKMRFINLLPNCSAMGTAVMSNASYTEYVTRFAREVQPDVLAFDEYPSFECVSTRFIRDVADYRATLALFRRLALEQKIPLWNYFRWTAFQTSGTYSTPATEAEMRWQTLTSLVYGATGIMYFNYPPGAFVSTNGTLRLLAPMAKRVNLVLLAYAPHLLHATSTDVWLVPAGSGQRPASSGNTSIVTGVAVAMDGSVIQTPLSIIYILYGSSRLKYSVLRRGV
jgi:hypothetical protein